jgi:hypothetical protein
MGRAKGKPGSLKRRTGKFLRSRKRDLGNRETRTEEQGLVQETAKAKGKPGSRNWRMDITPGKRRRGKETTIAASGDLETVWEAESENRETGETEPKNRWRNGNWNGKW